MHKRIMHTMNVNKNPVIRVTPEARKNLKIIAAETGETMQDVVERLAKQERMRMHKKEAKKETQE